VRSAYDSLRVARKTRKHEVTEALPYVIMFRGTPKHICFDNALEFVGEEPLKRLAKARTGTLHSEPGDHREKVYCEKLQWKLRNERLNGEILTL
jgi:hypothetical protein